MKPEKPHCRTKVVRTKSPDKKYLVFFICMILSLSILSINAAIAKPYIKTENFVLNTGYSEHKSREDFSQAVKAYHQEDYVYAARLLRVLALQEHAKAQYLLATQYDAGLGIEVNKEVAFYLYQQAAKSGLRAAHHNLAVSYANGQGTKKNIQKAIYWWKVAAENGHIDAQYNLGMIYTSGHGKIEPDLDKALKWWRMAAINGDAAAQFNLGALYANGIGMSSRTCEASRWWEKSAENGFVRARMALALLETKHDHAICP